MYMRNDELMISQLNKEFEDTIIKLQYGHTISITCHM